jgi:predicted RNA methylase
VAGYAAMSESDKPCDPSTIVPAVKDALVAAFAEQSAHGYQTGSLAAAFFRVWMKERGNAYYFLFQKNLRVTNMQHAELLALVSAYAFDVASRQRVRLQFSSSSDFTAAVQALLDSIPPTANQAEHSEIAEWFAQTYAHLLFYTAIVDPLFGSASIHLPPHLDVHLDAVCGLSGYIHSCGRNVFHRNVSKATAAHFATALRRYLDRFSATNGERRFFTVYAHEDFTPYDRPRERQLRDGLDDVKIHIDKSYMGPDPLVDVVRQLRDEFSDQLDVAHPGNFHQNQVGVTRDRTLWLVSDYGIQRLLGEDGQERLSRAGRRYYICYEQLFDNKNPFQIFDENKPAWVAHTTIPHTLMAAMINVTVPAWRSVPVQIADPFVGSGTTWVEGAKYPGVALNVSDKSELATQAAIDNTLFFSLSLRDLRALVSTLRAVAEKVEEPGAEPSKLWGDQKVTTRNRIAKLADRALEWERLTFTDDAALHILKAENDYAARVVFYVALRAHRRHAHAVRRNETTLTAAFVKEANGLADQVDRYIELRERKGTGEATLPTLALCSGDYSCSVTLDQPTLEAFARAAVDMSLEARDARQLSELARGSNGFDVVVTDPPYGFNTDEDAQSLASLYASVLREAIRSLRSGGQLVVCVPESSTVGKNPAAFTHRTIIAHQVIAFAAEAGREVVSPARSVPGPKILFQPPYYWASERALRRSILHFQIIDSLQSQKTPGGARVGNGNARLSSR